MSLRIYRERFTERLAALCGLKGAPSFELGELVNPVINVNEGVEPAFNVESGAFALGATLVDPGDAVVVQSNRQAGIPAAGIFWCRVPANVAFRLVWWTANPVAGGLEAHFNLTNVGGGTVLQAVGFLTANAGAGIGMSGRSEQFLSRTQPVEVRSAHDAGIGGQDVILLVHMIGSVRLGTL